MYERIGDVIDNKYQVLELIGEGGFASVYKAQKLENDEFVAIKFYSGQDDVDMPRFHREVTMMSLIDHENVIKILDHNLQTPDPYIVMPLAKCSLEKCIEDLKSSEEQILDIFLKACEGIKELHKNGIYHRDIKASNILISRINEILIADLGLARLENRGPTAITPSYDCTGTEMYIPPEIIHVMDIKMRMPKEIFFS
jgi:eukaryotic-like serine/threonine-protein kinase